jgi:hypothetical protein
MRKLQPLDYILTGAAGIHMKFEIMNRPLFAVL